MNVVMIILGYFGLFSGACLVEFGLDALARGEYDPGVWAQRQGLKADHGFGAASRML